jgi:two-component system, sensor histidine kinase and response regulator
MGLKLAGTANQHQHREGICNMSNTTRPHLLLVDDDPTNLVLLRRLLEPDYQCTCVNSGAETLAALKQAPYDVVLLDIMMPIMTGLQVLEVIRATPAIATVPVILVSALSDSSDITRGLELGANDYITKPVDLSVVPARINTQLMLKQLVDERNQVIEDLRAAQATRERFFRIATHEMKNPLANLRLAHHLLRTYTADNSKAQDTLQTMGQTISTMQEVINDFLESATIQSGKLDLNMASVPLERMLWEVVQQYETAATRKQISLQVLSTVGTVWGDYSRLMQVTANLVSNAIKYSPPSSTVSLWSEVRNQQIFWCVADQGKGVPANERPYLFAEFGRTSNRPTGGESSTGLGLWIVKQLVALHQGEVGAEFPDEGGSIFWVALPQYG